MVTQLRQKQERRNNLSPTDLTLYINNAKHLWNLNEKKQNMLNFINRKGTSGFLAKSFHHWTLMELLRKTGEENLKSDAHYKERYKTDVWLLSICSYRNSFIFILKSTVSPFWRLSQVSSCHSHLQFPERWLESFFRFAVGSLYECNPQSLPGVSRHPL